LRDASEQRVLAGILCRGLLRPHASIRYRVPGIQAQPDEGEFAAAADLLLVRERGISGSGDGFLAVRHRRPLTLPSPPLTRGRGNFGLIAWTDFDCTTWVPFPRRFAARRG